MNLKKVLCIIFAGVSLTIASDVSQKSFEISQQELSQQKEEKFIDAWKLLSNGRLSEFYKFLDEVNNFSDFPANDKEIAKRALAQVSIGPKLGSRIVVDVDNWIDERLPKAFENLDLRYPLYEKGDTYYIELIANQRMNISWVLSEDQLIAEKINFDPSNIKDKKILIIGMHSGQIHQKEIPFRGNTIAKYRDKLLQYSNVYFLDLLADPLQDRNFKEDYNELDSFSEQHMHEFDEIIFDNASTYNLKVESFKYFPMLLKQNGTLYIPEFSNGNMVKNKEEIKKKCEEVGLIFNIITANSLENKFVNYIFFGGGVYKNNIKKYSYSYNFETFNDVFQPRKPDDIFIFKVKQ